MKTKTFALLMLAAGVAFADAQTGGTPTDGTQRQPTIGRFANQSVRAKLWFDAQAILGFVITEHPRTVLIRGLGPSLERYGLPKSDVMADPVLELYNAKGEMIAYNDNWAMTTLMVHTPEGVRDLARERTVEVGTKFDRVLEMACDLAGCDRFPWITGTREAQSRDAALLIKRLPVGVYTVIVRSKHPDRFRGEVMADVFIMDPRWDPLPEAFDKPLDLWYTRVPGP
jgi:hypothetical protein